MPGPKKFEPVSIAKESKHNEENFLVSREIVFRDDPYFVSQVLGDEIFFFLRIFSRFITQSAWRRSSTKVCGLPFLSFAISGEFS